ncbi:hypothetical protein HYQ46_003517 [Verticillium longisporum]|nr:hypothetical protein HYQ46_003517 [Verticillium longisporum]
MYCQLPAASYYQPDLENNILGAKCTGAYLRKAAALWPLVAQSHLSACGLFGAGSHRTDNSDCEPDQ